MTVYSSQLRRDIYLTLRCQLGTPPSQLGRRTTATTSPPTSLLHKACISTTNYSIMALHRGIQSAVFYYLSCAPCADARYRKKRKQEAALGRADWEELEAQMPNLYRHPSPSSTNPHWQAEIALGPALTRGKRKANPAGSQRELKSSQGSNLPSSVDLPGGARTSDERADGGWNLRQYQREDEQLWGTTVTEPPWRGHLDGQGNTVDGPTRPAKVKLKGSSSSLSTFQEYRNPTINDLHPAIVTRVNTRADVAWMLQPPPVAEIMSGKQPVSRSRSNSGNSRPSTNGGHSLARQLSTRIVEEKLHGGELGLPRARSSRSQRSTQSNERLVVSSTTANEGFAQSPSKKEKIRPSHLVPPDSSADSGSSIARKQSLVPDEAAQYARRISSRPQLSTIKSDPTSFQGDGSSSFTPADEPKENYFPNGRRASSNQSADRDRTTRRSELVVDPSFKTLPSPDMSALAFNTQIFAVAHPPGGQALQESRPVSGKAEDDDERTNTGGPEIFDSWYTPEFELDKWVHEHTKREVRQRWSMDL